MRKIDQNYGKHEEKQMKSVKGSQICQPQKLGNNGIQENLYSTTDGLFDPLIYAGRAFQ